MRILLLLERLTMECNVKNQFSSIKSAFSAYRVLRIGYIFCSKYSLGFNLTFDLLELLK